MIDSWNLDKCIDIENFEPLRDINHTYFALQVIKQVTTPN